MSAVSQTPNCRLCGSPEIGPVWVGPIRSGAYGSLTPGSYEIVACRTCQVHFLHPAPNSTDDFYTCADYRLAYNQDSAVSTFMSEYDPAQADRLVRIGLERLRGKVVGDFGCGGGSFLDAVHGIARQTIAVEPFAGYQASLSSRGHQVYSWTSELLSSAAGQLDVAVTFAVVEHVADPVGFLRDIQGTLKSGGVVHIVTPNRNEILMQLRPAGFESFYYRTAHLWYFDAASLAWAARQAGFSEIRIGYQHRYDLSNVVVWLRDHRPSGNAQLDLFDSRLNHQWSDYLEARGWADNLWLTARKT